MAKALHWEVDWVLLSCFALLSFIGLVLIYTLDIHLFYLQLSGLAIGVALMVILSLLPFLKLIQWAPFVYFLNIFLLGLVLLTSPIKGAHRWLSGFLFNFQPSEMYKFSLLLISWWFIYHLPQLKEKKVPLKLSLFLSLTFPLFLILIEPDLGTTLFLGLAFLVAWLPFLFSPKSFLLSLFFLAIFTPFMWYQLKPYQQQRLTSFLNPLADPYKSGYNIIQAQLTIHNGGIWGKLNSTYHYQDILPEVKTDFIFSAWVEDAGFMGGIFLIFLYSLILLRLAKIAAPLPPLEKIPLILIIFFIPIQALIHMAINLQLLPVTGLPLPFISYGRSSLITNFALLGLLNSRLRYQGKTPTPPPTRPPSPPAERPSLVRNLELSKMTNVQ